uniref:hypothetical protein n=1 Tax=Streptococcus ferus TaxID=1345 RepID=UPI0035A049F5
QHSEGTYSFINDSAENILNDDDFKYYLTQKIGRDEATQLLNGDTSTSVRSRYSYGDNLSLNDLVSENYMRANARGDVLVLMGTQVPRDNVLAQTELPLLIHELPAVTAINGIPVAKLRQMTPEQAFEAVQTASLKIQSQGMVYRGEESSQTPAGQTVTQTVEIMDISDTDYGKGKVTPPKHLDAYEKGRDRIARLSPDKIKELGLEKPPNQEVVTAAKTSKEVVPISRGQDQPQETADPAKGGKTPGKELEKAPRFSKALEKVSRKPAETAKQTAAPNGTYASSKEVQASLAAFAKKNPAFMAEMRKLDGPKGNLGRGK